MTDSSYLSLSWFVSYYLGFHKARNWKDLSWFQNEPSIWLKEWKEKHTTLCSLPVPQGKESEPIALVHILVSVCASFPRVPSPERKARTSPIIILFSSAMGKTSVCAVTREYKPKARHLLLFRWQQLVSITWNAGICRWQWSYINWRQSKEAKILMKELKMEFEVFTAMDHTWNSFPILKHFTPVLKENWFTNHFMSNTFQIH